MQEEKFLKPDFNKLRYTIKIDVYQNSHQLSVKIPDGEENATYQSIIGTLDCVKLSLFLDQSRDNMKAWIAQREIMDASVTEDVAENK